MGDSIHQARETKFAKCIVDDPPAGFQSVPLAPISLKVVAMTGYENVIRTSDSRLASANRNFTKIHGAK